MPLVVIKTDIKKLKITNKKIKTPLKVFKTIYKKIKTPLEVLKNNFNLFLAKQL